MLTTFLLGHKFMQFLIFNFFLFLFLLFSFAYLLAASLKLHVKVATKQAIIAKE